MLDPGTYNENVKGYNTIYNNYFNNTNNAMDGGNNTWNIAQTAGTDIIGGSWLGRNYWSDYTGEDSDGDGLGDTQIPYNSSGSIENGGDLLPLVKPSAP
jgi:nitrous oxidase accessory protein NosD